MHAARHGGDLRIDSGEFVSRWHSLPCRAASRKMSRNSTLLIMARMPPLKMEEIWKIIYFTMSDALPEDDKHVDAMAEWK